jgi:hypothetical protein
MTGTLKLLVLPSAAGGAAWAVPGPFGNRRWPMRLTLTNEVPTEDAQAVMDVPNKVLISADAVGARLISSPSYDRQRPAAI